MGAVSSVERVIRAPAETVWGLISDVTRMGEWSPETVGCQWLDDGNVPAVGARFRGRNSNGRRSWSTPCQVRASEPGRVFAFEVKPVPFLVTARWAFHFEPTTDGCHVTETVEDRRGRLGAWVATR
jgi:uncharacterized protein YndB with AHSA1/START domain